METNAVQQDAETQHTTGLSEFPSGFLTQVESTLSLNIIHTRIICMLPDLNS